MCNRWRLQRLRVLALGGLAIPIALATLLLGGSNTLAYHVGAKWQDTTSVLYYIDPNLDSTLTSGASSSVEAAASKWNTSRMILVRTYSSHPNIISTANFTSSQPCYIADPYNTVGVNCVYANNTTISRNAIYFNTYYSWNTAGIVDCGAKRWDVMASALHEFGHSYELKDSPAGHPEAVMSYRCSLLRDLAEDDKNGATQIYGIRTGWEDGFALGEINTIAYALNVRGYGGLSSPELGRRGTEFGATPVSGNWMELLAGEALSSQAYAYMRLFTSANDSGTQRNYLTIKPGMRLKWFQYNYQQRTMSVDFRMTDGSTLRDSGLTTTSGLPVHPAWRHNSPTRQWFFNEIDLSPLANKTIDQWMIAYDNSQTGWQYVFRAYFDNVRVEY